MAPKVTLQFLVDEEVAVAIEQAAAEEHRSVSNFVAMAVLSHMVERTRDKINAAGA